MLGYQMAVLMLGDQVAVLMIEDQEPSAAEAVVQNKCSRSRGTEQVQQKQWCSQEQQKHGWKNTLFAKREC
jgi:hypothetical protein